ncbi:Alpha/Beta hydrolase protein [Syncephalis pseudoplumigaleata]|uniref:Alpha/Beta hydrolase protein n=1 Tax=Syncephalis pseudoplumigaleata TaxID=1712513 RepID=A0A4P9Z6E9_9FUNG|nr:Alpha/Beta hydrolase protein [Syncephalis pseudoplumigaleata]|eukprot:RKP27421.1 Alpha/Beta hydrolase protein [Syncephalis pseudoplumigaleata]
MSVEGVFEVTDRDTNSLAEFLSQRGCQVLTIDNHVPDGHYTVKSMAEDTAQLLDHLHWTTDNHIVGISMGGMIAMQLASDHPAYVASLCLISTTSTWQPTPVPDALPRTLDLSSPNYEVEAMLVEYPETWLAAPSKHDPRQTNQEYTLEVWIAPHVWQHALTDHCPVKLGRTRLSSSKPPTPEGYKRQLWAVEHYDLGEEGLARIARAGYPVLVCTGDQDAIVAASNSEFLADRLKAPLKLFAHCGHNVNVQECERLNQLLLDFLSMPKGGEH